MQPLLTREAVRALDAAAIAKGVIGRVLMENAGRGATDVMVETFDDVSRVVILGGPGQNGGDAWVVARHLRTRGIDCRAILVADLAKVRGDARANLDALEALGVDVEIVLPEQAGKVRLEGASLVVDGLLGTGLDRPIAGGYAALIDEIANTHAPVFALDMPSGVDATTGQQLGAAVRADVTATFAALKSGLFQHPARGLAGDVHLVDIGVPPAVGADTWLIEDEDCRSWLGRRAPDAHKGSAGHVYIIGGDKAGAAQLASLAAMRAGAGWVTLVGAPPPRAEIMHATELPAIEQGAFVLGPGLGLDARGRDLAQSLSLELALPGVLDADALSYWAEQGIEKLRDAAAPRVLTPHPGEAGRLLGIKSTEVQRRRYEVAEELAERSGHTVVLKGAGSIVASAGLARVSDAGTPALGVAGTGDVLAGVIGTLLLTLPAPDAAAAGVHWHARAGELAAASDRGVFAGEVADALPRFLD